MIEHDLSLGIGEASAKEALSPPVADGESAFMLVIRACRPYSTILKNQWNVSFLGALLKFSPHAMNPIGLFRDGVRMHS
jgi:hypothetical protein